MSSGARHLADQGNSTLIDQQMVCASGFAAIGRVSACVLVPRQVLVCLQPQCQRDPTWPGRTLDAVEESSRGYVAKRWLASIREGDASMPCHRRSRVCAE